MTRSAFDPPPEGPPGRFATLLTRRRLLQAAGVMGLGLLGWAVWKRAPRLDVEAVTRWQSPALPALAEMRLVNDTPYHFELGVFPRQPQLYGGPDLLGLYLRDGVLGSCSVSRPWREEEFHHAVLQPSQGCSFIVPLIGTGPQCVGVTAYLTLPRIPRASDWFQLDPTDSAAAAASAGGALPAEGPVQFATSLWSPPIFPDGIVRTVPPTSTLAPQIEAVDAAFLDCEGGMPF